MSNQRLETMTATQRASGENHERIAGARRDAMALAAGPVDVTALSHAWDERVTSEEIAAFEASFVDTVQTEPERRRAWLEALRGAIETSTASATTLSDACLNSRARERLQEQAASWLRMTDPFVVWESRRHYGDGPITDAVAIELGILLQLDRKVWLEVLDKLPWPSLIWNTVWLSKAAEDREILVELVRCAQPMYDEEGRWNRSVALLLVAELIQMHGERLHDPVARAQWLHEAYRLLLARPDGTRIAMVLLADLSGQHLGGHSEGEPSTSQTALEVLVETLAQSGFRIDLVRGLWAGREKRAQGEARDTSARPSVRDRHAKKPVHKGEGHRRLATRIFPLLYGSACVLDAAGAPREELERCWAWLVEILEGRAPDLSIAASSPSWPEAVQPIARLLARLPAPVAAWRAAYARLEPQRRRSQFLVHYEDKDSDEPSLALVRIGLHACTFLADTPAAPLPREDLHAFFWTLYDAARRLWLTAAIDPLDSRKELVAECFAFMPSVFGDTLRDALKRAAPPVSTEPWSLSRAACLLSQKGVEPRRLANLFTAAGADLAGALRDAFLWASRTGLDNEFPPEFQALARALDLTLADERTEPAEQRQQRPEALFVQRIPWAAPLLDRLRQDGCAPVRVEALDDTGAAWLVQAHAATMLRETFGLAPELRILASTGGLDGRDLLRAAEAPEGESEVDPDLLIIATNRKELAARLPLLPGPWGQRIPWVPSKAVFPPLMESIGAHAQDFDLFHRVDPVHGRTLIGREEELALVTSRLLHGKSVGIFGLSKVGKSSLLQEVAERVDPIGARRALLHRPPSPDVGTEIRVLVIALDVQQLAGRGIVMLLDLLDEQLRDRLDTGARQPISPAPRAEPPGDPAASETAPQNLESALDDFERTLRLALALQPLPVCFILDECDLLFEDHLGEPGIRHVELLFERLRRVAEETQRVSLALIGRAPEPLRRLTLGAADNPLRSFCEVSWLGPLRRNESDALLTRLGLRVGLAVGPKTKERAWVSTGGLPFLLRQYGSALLELAKRDRPESRNTVPTDDFCAEATELLRRRALVLEVGREIRALLARCSPPALELFQALTAPITEDLHDVVAKHGGWEGSAARLLRSYGLLAGSAEAPWIAEALRPRARLAPPGHARAVRRRRARHGA